MSRFLPENHPKRGICTFCQKTRLLVADLGVDAMLIATGSVRLSLTGGNAHATHHHCMSFKHPLCRSCTKRMTHHGPPIVNLASRGVTKRLTRKQTVTAAKKLARDLKKMQDDS